MLTYIHSKVRLAFEHIENRKRQGLSHEDACNSTALELVQCADVHCRTFIVQSADEMTKELHTKLSTELTLVLRQLVELYAVDTCMRLMGDLLRVRSIYAVLLLKFSLILLIQFQFTNLNDKGVQELQSKLERLLTALRPNAVGIVDGFDIPDIILNSALGAYDGNVYERLFAEAQKSPLNQDKTNKSFHLYLKPFMKSNL